MPEPHAAHSGSQLTFTLAPEQMHIPWIIALVFTPVILYAIALGYAALYRGMCSRCLRHGLRMVGGYRWDGPDCGGSIAYYQCEKCGSRFKKNKKDWSEPSEVEWNQNVKN